jgi:hypothetical protein
MTTLVVLFKFKENNIATINHLQNKLNEIATNVRKATVALITSRLVQAAARVEAIQSMNSSAQS